MSAYRITLAPVHRTQRVAPKGLKALEASCEGQNGCTATEARDVPKGARKASAGSGNKNKRRVGRLKVGSGATQGFCARGHIKSVVRRRAGALRACYDKELKTKPTLAGKLQVRWTIGRDGQTNNVSFTSNSLGDAKVAACVKRVLTTMRFKEPEGGICVVQWPFVFNSN